MAPVFRSAYSGENPKRRRCKGNFPYPRGNLYQETHPASLVPCMPLNVRHGSGNILLGMPRGDVCVMERDYFVAKTEHQIFLPLLKFRPPEVPSTQRKSFPFASNTATNRRPLHTSGLQPKNRPSATLSSQQRTMGVRRVVCDNVQHHVRAGITRKCWDRVAQSALPRKMSTSVTRFSGRVTCDS